MTALIILAGVALGTAALGALYLLAVSEAFADDGPGRRPADPDDDGPEAPAAALREGLPDTAEWLAGDYGRRDDR